MSRYGHLPAVAAFFFGIKPAVVAIVAFAAWRIGGRVIRNAVLAGIAVAAFVALAVFSVPFPLVVLGAALAGLAGREAFTRELRSAIAMRTAASPAACRRHR